MRKVEDIYAGSRSDEWGTPQALWDILNAQYFFIFDLAASAANTKCGAYFSKDASFLNALLPDFPLMFWLNPPFSLSREFFRKLRLMREENDEIRGVAIYKASNTETETWQKEIFPATSWIHFLAKRVNYEGCGKSAPFPSALIGYNVPEPVGVPGVTVWLR
jgi:hypothetical protein